MAITSEIIAVGIMIAGVIIAFILYEVYRWLQKRATATESKLDDILLIAFGKPFIILVLFFSFYIAIRYFIPIPENYTWIFESQYLTAFYIIIGTWVVSNLTYNIIAFYGKMFAGKTDTDLDDRIISLFELGAKYVIWFIALLLILSTLEIDITPLIAGAGIIGLAFALAAQDIISNFFGGAMIMVDKPFKLGDRIQIDTFIGDVVAIGPRSTRMQTLDYQLVTVPNSKMATSVIINYALPEARLKIKIPVSVAYGSDVARVRSILLDIGKEAAARSEYVLEDPQPAVYFLEFGESSLNFTLVVWARTFTLVWEVQDFINSRVDERFREAGIEIPFPQMDVHLRKT
ncbi:MAG: mechanosensitive ion channel family protein [Methanomicrobiales archaeon]|nr:mechanosensitive ion channel family protein [Methanomicrobiales archaeon]